MYYVPPNPFGWRRPKIITTTTITDVSHIFQLFSSQFQKPSLSRMSFNSRVTGGAALRTRSDDSSDDVWWWILSSPFWFFLFVGIVCLFIKYDICECLCYIICALVSLMKSGFEKLYRLIFRRAAPHEQQTMPASIQMGNIRRTSNERPIRMQYMNSDSQGPPDYQDFWSLEEPLPVYKP